MKLRIYRDSLRFRLSPADVANLLRRGSVTETTRFGVGNELLCELQICSGIRAMRAIFESNRICVQVPRPIARNWGGGDAVGINHLQDVGQGKTLEILIEKDFECLENPMNRAEEALYPNPKNGCR